MTEKPENPDDLSRNVRNKAQDLNDLAQTQLDIMRADINIMSLFVTVRQSIIELMQAHMERLESSQLDEINTVMKQSEPTQLMQGVGMSNSFQGLREQWKPRFDAMQPVIGKLLENNSPLSPSERVKLSSGWDKFKQALEQKLELRLDGGQARG
jgi:hypothetical protein